jgi:hypothetical protein
MNGESFFSTSTRINQDPIREVRKPTVVYIDLMRHSNRFAGKGEWRDPESDELFSFDEKNSILIWILW